MDEQDDLTSAQDVPGLPAADDPRRRILEAAWRAYDPAHPRQFRVVDVVREAGMSTKTFYEFYASRDELILDMVAYTKERLFRELARMLEELHEPEARFRRGVEVMMQVVEGTPLFVRGLGQEAESKLDQVVDQIVDTIIDIAMAAADESHQEGRLQRPPTRLEYEVLFSGTSFVLVRRIRDGRGGLKELVPELTSLMLRHLRS